MTTNRNSVSYNGSYGINADMTLYKGGQLRNSIKQQEVQNQRDSLSIQGTAVDGEILGEHEDEAAVDGALSGHDAVAVRMGRIHAEVGAAVLHEHVEFFETARIQEFLKPLAGGEFALLVLGVDTLLAAAEFRRSAALDQLLDFILLDTHNSVIQNRANIEIILRKKKSRVVRLLSFYGRAAYFLLLSLILLLAHSMKYFMFGPSVWPPACWRQASSPSSSPVRTGGICSLR